MFLLKLCHQQQCEIAFLLQPLVVQSRTQVILSFQWCAFEVFEQSSTLPNCEGYRHIENLFLTMSQAEILADAR